MTQDSCKPPVFIIGYMGSGKTTFGRALGKALGREFIDLDTYIENRFHTTVNRLFADRGEDGFRRLESAMLREAGEFCDVVIACGGGTPCFCGNMDYMLQAGKVVYLDTGTECIARRLIINRSRRPLVKDLSEDEIAGYVERNLALREPHYSRAHIRFRGEELENARQISASVSRFLASYEV